MTIGYDNKDFKILDLKYSEFATLLKIIDNNFKQQMEYILKNDFADYKKVVHNVIYSKIFDVDMEKEEYLYNIYSCQHICIGQLLVV